VGTFLNLVLSGAVTGAIYSIMASGLVLTYTTSGIFNFAHGAVAFATAYLYLQLNTGLGVPIVPALILSAFVFAPVLGLLLDRILLRRLSKAPVYAKIVGTIGLLVALPALMQWLVVTLGNKVLDLGLAGNPDTSQGQLIPGVGPTPPHVYHPLKGVALNTDQIAVFVVAAVAAIGLWYVLRRTRVGLEMRAVVDRDSLAALRGVNPARTSAVAWVLTMVLAGLGGVLIAPLFQPFEDFFFTLVVLGSLAAVVLGGLRSLPIAFAGGLLLGIIQNLVAGYSDDVLPKFIAGLTGLRSAVPYLLVVVLGLIFGRDRSRRAGSVSDERPRPDHRQGMSALKRRLPWIIFVVCVIGFSMDWINVSWLRADSYDQTVIAQSLAMSIIFLSFVVVTGMGGMVSLAQTTFVTAGGFAAGWALEQKQWNIEIPLVIHNGQINFLWAALLAAIVAAALGALIALPSTRLGGVFLAIWTLAIAFFFSLMVFPYEPIGHGQLGWTIRPPSIDLPVFNWVHGLLTTGDTAGHFDFSSTPDQILLFFALFGAITLLIHALQRSASGRAMLAVRSSEVAAEASGVRPNRTKIMIFALSAGIAGFGGALLGLFSFTASNDTAPPVAGLFWLALAVLFGIRRPGGALLAGFALAASTAVFHWIAGLLPGGDVNALVTSVYFVPILSGIGAINLAQEPDGILALAGQQNLAKRRAKERKARIAAAEAEAHDGFVPEHEVDHRDTTAMFPIGLNRREGLGVDGHGSTASTAGATLLLQGIVAGYGDAEVLHGVTLALSSGTVVALLGANGAGKSTVCSVAAGLVEPTFGTVSMRGVDITHAAIFERARKGMLLVPEARGIFPGLTVEENIMVLLRSAEQGEKAYQRFPILAQRRKQPAGLLSGGEQQMLSLAPAFGDPPTVLIADEPTLGLAPLAAEEVMRAITELRDLGTAVLLVEEHAQNALNVADTLIFMELGTIVWTGPRQDADIELLSSAYLGGTVTH
jgi:branched-subunit amino acid ABC-type transport system permease component/ABC-type branched-subunit amino acid transport system ATPase component